MHYSLYFCHNWHQKASSASQAKQTWCRGFWWSQEYASIMLARYQPKYQSSPKSLEFNSTVVQQYHKDRAPGHFYLLSIWLACRSSFRACSRAAQLVLTGMNFMCTQTHWNALKGMLIPMQCMALCLCEASAWPVCLCKPILWPLSGGQEHLEQDRNVSCHRCRWDLGAIWAQDNYKQEENSDALLSEDHCSSLPWSLWLGGGGALTASLPLLLLQ